MAAKRLVGGPSTGCFVACPLSSAHCPCCWQTGSPSFRASTRPSSRRLVRPEESDAPPSLTLTAATEPRKIQRGANPAGTARRPAMADVEPAAKRARMDNGRALPVVSSSSSSSSAAAAAASTEPLQTAHATNPAGGSAPVRALPSTHDAAYGQWEDLRGPRGIGRELSIRFALHTAC
jgi:hypothetical protein